jgi:CheY-like chemotaxis protein
MATNLTPKAVVLVVEDEPLVRMMAADFVETAGFEVVATLKRVAA